MLLRQGSWVQQIDIFRRGEGGTDYLINEAFLVVVVGGGGY